MHQPSSFKLVPPVYRKLQYDREVLKAQYGLPYSDIHTNVVSIMYVFFLDQESVVQGYEY